MYDETGDWRGRDWFDVRRSVVDRGWRGGAHSGGRCADAYSRVVAKEGNVAMKAAGFVSFALIVTGFA